MGKQWGIYEGLLPTLWLEGGVEWVNVMRPMVGDSKAKGEEKGAGVDAEGGSWYKRHFRERKEKVFKILVGDTLLEDNWKCEGDSWPL